MRLRKKVTILLFVVSLIAAVGFGGAGRGLSIASPATTNKDAKICDPTECRIGQDKRPANCACRYSALVINLYGGAVDLTNVQNGVDFDLDAEGLGMQKVSWTMATTQGAFLFLDRNGNGVVDNGLELFGNLTPQLPSPTDPDRNGFLGLARYDRGELGGNGDGVIDSKDAVFASLRLWRDVNHNGISEPGELRNLREAGVEKISLKYMKSESRDHWGNLVRDQADVVVANHSAPGTAYDVLLLPAL